MHSSAHWTRQHVVQLSNIVVVVVAATCLFGDHFLTSATVVAIQHVSCSNNDLTNGSLCECGAALARECNTYRHEKEACKTCATSVLYDNCTDVTRHGFCDECSSPVEFQWFDQGPGKDIVIELYDVVSVCKNQNKSVQPILMDAILDMLPTLQLVGCNDLVIEGYLIEKGFNVTNLGRPALNLRGRTLDFFHDCCLRYKTEPLCDSKTGPAWALLSKLTGGCQIDRITSALEKVGVDLQTIDDDTPFLTMYEIDLTTVPKSLVPLVGAIIFGDLFAGSVRTLIGLAFGTAERLGCGRSWVVPGADHLYANVFRLQAHFYFPPTYAGESTCGDSTASENIRLDACHVMGTFLYESMNVSGMSIMGCVVMCASSRLENVEGVFVSVSLPIIEVAKSTEGYSAKRGGIKDTLDALAKNGINVSNDVGTTVGIGFNYTVNPVSSDDVFKDLIWTGVDTQTSLKFIVAQLEPNVTQGMLAYKPPPSPPPSRTTTSSTIIIAAIVPSTLVVGVVVGLLFQYRRTPTPTEIAQPDLVVNAAASTHYEDRLDDVMLNPTEDDQSTA